MADTPDAIKKSIRLYLLVGAGLFGCTILTVLVATVPALDFGGHGFDAHDMWIGLAIASFKATLVAYIFMHLNHERKAIYWIFFGAIFFAICLYKLTHLGETDVIHDKYFLGSSASAGHAPVEPAAPAPAPDAPAATPAPEQTPAPAGS